MIRNGSLFIHSGIKVIMTVMMIMIMVIQEIMILFMLRQIKA